jgi:hypothetical protein
VSSNRYQFRNVAEGLHFATASDRYAGWLGQIYSEDKGYKITRTQKIIKGQSIAEEKLPVRSVVEYFEHYSAIEPTSHSTHSSWMARQSPHAVLPRSSSTRNGSPPTRG